MTSATSNHILLPDISHRALLDELIFCIVLHLHIRDNAIKEDPGMANDVRAALLGGVCAIIGGGMVALINGAFGALPTYIPPNHHGFQIVPGDRKSCNGADISATYSGSRPTDGLCEFGTEGTIAVCWDGKDSHNKSNPSSDATLAWCTYKHVTPAQCEGGSKGAEGIIWVCKDNIKK